VPENLQKRGAWRWLCDIIRNSFHRTQTNARMCNTLVSMITITKRWSVAQIFCWIKVMSNNSKRCVALECATDIAVHTWGFSSWGSEWHRWHSVVELPTHTSITSSWRMPELRGRQSELAVDRVQVDGFSTNADERVLSRRRHGCDEVIGCRSFG